MSETKTKKKFGYLPIAILLVIGVMAVSGAVLLMWTSTAYTTQVQTFGLGGLAITATDSGGYNTKLATPTTLSTFMKGPSNLTPYPSAGALDMIVCTQNLNLQADDQVLIDINVKNGAVEVAGWSCIAEIIDISKPSDCVVADIKALTLGPDGNGGQSVTISKIDATHMLWEPVGTGHPSGGPGNALMLTFTMPSNVYTADSPMLTYSVTVTMSVVTTHSS